LLKQDTIINKSWLQYFEIKINTLTLEYPESLPDSARLSRREFEKSMRFAMAAKLFSWGEFLPARRLNWCLWIATLSLNLLAKQASLRFNGILMNLQAKPIMLDIVINTGPLIAIVADD
jgi:hypothetical protein